MNDVYKRLAAKLDGLPNGFPATDKGVELKILQKIFTPDEAEMALRMRPIPETAEAVAERVGKPLDEIRAMLDRMAKRGEIGSAKMKGAQVFMLVPFVVGIFEFQLNRLDKELSDLLHEYAPTLLGTLGEFEPAVMRVVPLNIQIDAEHQVKPYEDLRQAMEKAKSFQLMECICRKEQALQGHKCRTDTEVCLAFANHENAYDKYPLGRIITKDKALDVLAKADKDGLVHSTYNVQKGQMFVCNCCSCCCGMIRGVNHFGAPHLMAKSNYVANIDQDACEACGICAEERCPMTAISEDDGVYVVQPDQCIGCGACTTGCPTEAITLVRKPESEQDEPPKNIVDWYMKRAANRGVSISID